MKGKKILLFSLLLALLLTACNKKVEQKVSDNATKETKVEEKVKEEKAEEKAEEKEEAKDDTKITIEDLVKNLDNKEYVIIDTREDSLYNGFKDGDAKRGGHIKNAIQFTADWLGNINESKFEKFAEGKGITKDKKLVFYDTDMDRLSKVISKFDSLGYNAIQYDSFIDYANTESNPMESYERFETLVSPSFVSKLIKNEKPETYDNDDFMILEVSWGDESASPSYLEGHIPGAYHFDTSLIEDGPVWNLSDPKIIENNLISMGINADKTVIIYSEDASAGLRVVYSLEWAGVKDVRLLNGGLEAWKKSGGELETESNAPVAVDSFGVTVPQRPEITIATAQDAVKAMETGTKLVSNRSWEEYIGETSGYSYIERKGEPKGAIFGFSGTNASNMDDYYDPDGTLRNPYELVALWKTVGINYGDSIGFYCGTGWRSTIPWFMTQMIGWDEAVMYDGGWNSWQMDETLEVQIGDPNNGEKPDALNDYK